MAYMTKDGKGPYPHKAGDYCGNHHPGSPMLRMWNVDPVVQQREHDAWLAKMRFGRPRPCKAGTTKEREAAGDVGLYLKADSPLYCDGDTEIPTPPELMEPPE